MVETYKSPSGNGIIYDGIMGNLDRPSEDPAKITSVFKRGLMSPTTSIRPQARPEEPTEETASTRKRDPISDLIASMGDYTDDREALANAVAGPSSITTDRDSALAEYEALPPAPTMGGSMRPASRGSQTEQAIPTEVFEGETSDLLDFISSGEGTYTSSNRGTISNEIVGSTNQTIRNGKPLNEMTIAEIQQLQSITDPNNEDRLFAVGRYQVIPETMEMAVKKLDLSPDTVFNEETQNRIGLYLIGEKRPAVGDFLQGGDTSLDSAMLSLAKEFASIPVPYDVVRNGRTIKAGQSYYAGKGGNKARHTIAETRNMLLSARNTG